MIKKILASALLFAALLPAATAQDAATEVLLGDHKIIELSDKYLALLDSSYPEEAARAGTLGYQTDLDIRTRQREAINRETIISFQDTLNRIKVKQLSPSKQTAYYTLKELVDKKAFDITTANRLEKDPLWYLSAVDAVYDILLKDYKPFLERLTDAMKRLQELPVALSAAQDNLDNPPDLLLRIAIERAGLAYQSFNNITALMNRMAAEDEYTKEQIKVVMTPARKAVKDYQDFLKAMLDKKEYSDFRLGAENFAKLMQVYQIDTAPRKMLDLAAQQAGEARAQLLNALKPVIGGLLREEELANRTNGKGEIQILASDYYTAAAANAKKGTQYKDVLNAYLNAFNAGKNFFAEHNIFAPVELKILIAPAPKYLQRPYSDALYVPPFALLTRQSGDLLVTLPDGSKQNVVLPQFTEGKIKLSATANLSAGYNLMYGANTAFVERILKISADPAFINGWVKYSLNVAKEVGYLATDEDLLELAWHNYKAALLAEADVKMHTGEANYTQSLEALIAAGIEEKEAASALDISATAPGTYIAALLGEQEFKRLRAKHQRKEGGKKFNLAQFHTKLLSVGRVPLHTVEKALEQAYAEKKVDSFFNTLYF